MIAEMTLESAQAWLLILAPILSTVVTIWLGIVNARKTAETKEAVDGSITAWKADRKQAEEERLKIVELASHAAGAKDAKDSADATAAQVREALEAARKERAQSATIAKPGATASDSGVPLQDLRVVEQEDKEST